MQTPDTIRKMYRSLGGVSIAASGAVAPALLDITDRAAFDTVTVGDYSLRYLTEDALLEQGDEVAVSAGPLAGTYAVAEVPQRNNAFESVVGLVQS